MESSQLRSYLLRNLAGLTELDLSGQELHYLPDEVLQCSKTQVLKFARNKIREIPKMISGLRQLRILDASTNFLGSIPDTIVNCTYLTEINLENNRLTALPLNLGLLNHLKILKLGQNELESITNEIGFLESLSYLDLQGNKLWYMPFSIGNLHKLRHLNLSNNMFEHLPMPVCRIRSLVILNLSGNQLISLAPDFDNLRNLKELNLSSNRLKVVPPAVCETKQLRYLNLAANQLKELPSQLAKLSKLQVLHVQQNYLESVPEDLSNLSYLNVSQNNLHNFSLRGMKKLKYLNASKNLLENTPMALFNLNKLEHLKLNANRITFLSQDVVLLKNLKTLDLGNNRLTNLPQVINEFEHLDFFNIKGNSVNQRLHPALGEEGQRREERNEDRRGRSLRSKPPTGYSSTLAATKDRYKKRSGVSDVGQSRTLGPKAGMWTQNELLQDGFSPQLVSDSQSCVIIGSNNNNAEGAEMSLPDHLYMYNRREDERGRCSWDHTENDSNSQRQDDIKGGNSMRLTSNSFSVRHKLKGDSKFFKRKTFSQKQMENGNKHHETSYPDTTETHDLGTTNLHKRRSTSMESLSSTDFKLLGVCSQLEAMLNEELLHPVVTHQDSLSKSFKKKSIIKSPSGLWHLTQKEPKQDAHHEELSPLSTRRVNETLCLRSATPSRRRLVHAHSREPSFSPPSHRHQPEAMSKRQVFSPPFRRPAINMDMWGPELSSPPDEPSLVRHEPPTGWDHSPPPQRRINANPQSDHHPYSPPSQVLSRSNIDRFDLTHQGRTCVSSVDPKVMVIVPKNGAARPAHLMMQLETIPSRTLDQGQVDHNLIANIISLSPLLHVTTSQNIDCHGQVTMTIPMPSGNKKGKLHLLTVRADNSCIPCTAGYHVKNGYLTLQTGHLSGKVVVYTKSKCKYKACKSVEQLLNFHYI